MLSTQEILAAIEASREAIARLGVRELALFGSCARDEAVKGGDVDFVVDFEKKTFDAYMDLKSLLEQIVGGQVDLVIKDVINMMLRLAAAEDIDRGDMLMPAASGEVKAYNCSTENSCTLVAQSLEDKVNFTLFTWVLVELKIP